MNFLNKLLQAAKGVQAQLSPLDNGKTFKTVINQQQPPKIDANKYYPYPERGERLPYLDQQNQPHNFAAGSSFITESNGLTYYNPAGKEEYNGNTSSYYVVPRQYRERPTIPELPYMGGY